MQKQIRFLTPIRQIHQSRTKYLIINNLTGTNLNYYTLSLPNFSNIYLYTLSTPIRHVHNLRVTTCIINTKLLIYCNIIWYLSPT